MDTMLSKALREFTTGPLNQLLVNLAGQESQMWEDALKRFLRKENPWAGLLKFVREVAVPGTKKFIAADALGPNNPAGIKFYLGNNFKNHFLGKTEENVESTTIAVHQLEKSSRDSNIMAELGPEKRVIKLAHFHSLIQAQATGQEGPLLVNGYANVAYIEDENKNLWAVGAYWCSAYRVWLVLADSVEPPDDWDAGYQVLSRK